MPFHTVENADGSTTFQEVTGGGGSGEVRVEFADGRNIAFGAGQTDTDLTYIKLQEAGGADRYIIVTGTTITAETSRP